MALKLLAVMPSHSGTLVMEAVETLLGVQEIVLARGGSMDFFHRGGATVNLVRNALAAQFLQSDADLLLMLDADQAIDPMAVARMIDFDKPFVGCLYPKRYYNWSQVQMQAAGDEVMRVVHQAHDFVGHLKAGPDGRVPVTDGFAPAHHVGGGILLLRREVFEQLMHHYPELEGTGFGADAYPGLTHRWGFFNSIDNEEGIPLSEDISFCMRWSASGGEIWADVTTKAIHIGRWPFQGSYLDHVGAFEAAATR